MREVRKGNETEMAEVKQAEAVPSSESASERLAVTRVGKTGHAHRNGKLRLIHRQSTRELVRVHTLHH